MRPSGANRDATAQRVMDAAVELFARHGFAATGIRDIASGASLTSSSLYEYMTTKHDLLVDIMRGTITPLIGSGGAITATAATPAVRLAALAETHVWFHATFSHHTMVTDTEIRSLVDPGRSEIIDLRDAYERVWRRTVSAGVRAGGFDVDDVAVSARTLISMCTGIGGWFRSSGRIGIDRLCRHHADLVLATVRARDHDGRALRRADLEDVPVMRPVWSLASSSPA